MNPALSYEKQWAVEAEDECLRSPLDGRGRGYGITISL